MQRVVGEFAAFRLAEQRVPESGATILMAITRTAPRTKSLDAASSSTHFPNDLNLLFSYKSCRDLLLHGFWG